ncbi:DUF5388 domain-containing protein [Lactobacillus apis]|uniref:DUF5388 domain-containing protein n=1 Tax=Lactobacillus apis TaxID=303541 RepID=UPI002430E4D6|nr:DUF5388 domain-containing protein [Lactobacillus apis]
MTRLIKSNKTNQELQPDKTASINDFDQKLVKRSPKSESVTFDTSIRINNHIRNKLVALSTLGYAGSQKDAIELVFENFRDELDQDSKKELDMQIKTLEKRDAKMKR